MSIRPIDYTNLVSKSQEVSKIKQIENSKLEIQFDQRAVHQEKQINQNLKKVRNTSKSENLIINTNKKNKEGKKRGRHKKKEDKKLQVKSKENLGSNIDIKI